MEDWGTIPDETPIDDISGLIPKDITTRGQLNQVEAENIRKTVMKYLSEKPGQHLAPFTLSWSLELHKEMFGDVWEWAGQTRKKELNLGIPWYNVQVNLKNLLDDLQCWKKNGEDILEQAVHLHYKSVLIHPFNNGNGRWSRMLANIWLALHDHPIIMWPEAVTGNISNVRKEYIKAIKIADRGDINPLIELHRRFIDINESDQTQP